MSNFFFGLGAGHLPEETAGQIARKHGARLVNYVDPATHEIRHWFECPNLGAPHDENTARAVLAELARRHIYVGRVVGIPRSLSGFPVRCSQYQGSPAKCPHNVFNSEDGSIRCRGCHLHPDSCTCGLVAAESEAPHGR